MQVIICHGLKLDKLITLNEQYRQSSIPHKLTQRLLVIWLNIPMTISLNVEFVIMNEIALCFPDLTTELSSSADVLMAKPPNINLIILPINNINAIKIANRMELP
jgi:hypothetical protein